MMYTPLNSFFLFFVHMKREGNWTTRCRRSLASLGGSIPAPAIDPKTSCHPYIIYIDVAAEQELEEEEEEEGHLPSCYGVRSCPT